MPLLRQDPGRSVPPDDYNWEAYFAEVTQKPHASALVEVDRAKLHGLAIAYAELKHRMESLEK